MVTVMQTQAVWAPWIRDLAETLEPCLAEVKHQGKLKGCCPEPLAHGRLLHTMKHWENRWAATPTPPLPPATSYQLAHPGQTDHPCKKKKLNKQQNWKPVHSGGGGGCWKHNGEGGRSKELNSLKPSVNKRQEGHQQVGDRPLPEVGKEWRQQTTGLRPWAHTVRWLCNIEEQTVNITTCW
jgi:hypothetical protein